MNTTFILTGGAGRIINSIPALEKYQKLNPNDNFNIIVHGWEQVFWSHPTLQQKVVGAHQKGNFENYIKNNKVVSPEPYQLYRFYNQKINLTEAFDECINNTHDHSDLNYNVLHVSEYELSKIKESIMAFKQKHKKNKLVVFQPYGSSVEFVDGKPIDRSNRSMLDIHYLKVALAISKQATVIYASHPTFKPRNDNFTISIDDNLPYLRTLIGLVSQCDYFVGVCSVGQHVARSFNKPGLIFMGGTNENNFSYPNHFTIFRKKDTNPTYIPWRLSEIDCEFSDRANNNFMNFSDEEIEEAIHTISSNIGETINLNLAEDSSINGQYN